MVDWLTTDFPTTAAMHDLLANAHRVLPLPPCAERAACLERLAALLEAAEKQAAHADAPSLPVATPSSPTSCAPHAASEIHKASAGETTAASANGDSWDSLITAILLADLVPPLLACVQHPDPRWQRPRTMPAANECDTNQSLEQPTPCPFSIRLLSLLVRAAQRRLAAHGWTVQCDAATGAVFYQQQHTPAAITSSSGVTSTSAMTAPSSAPRANTKVASSSTFASSRVAEAERRAWPPTDLPTRAREPEWAQSLLLELPALTAPLRLLAPNTDRVKQVCQCCITNSNCTTIPCSNHHRSEAAFHHVCILLARVSAASTRTAAAAAASVAGSRAHVAAAECHQYHAFHDCGRCRTRHRLDFHQRGCKCLFFIIQTSEIFFGFNFR